MKRLHHAIAALALSLLPVEGLTAQWQVDAGTSSVDFDYSRDGKPATGVFVAFSGQGSFDPDAPESANLTIRIDSKSIDLSDDLASAFATSAEWFDSKHHRYITYTLTGLKRRPDGRFDASGLLNLRGETRQVASVISLDVDGGQATASGTLRLDRRDYLLGVGPSAIFVEIGPEVAVRFDLRARLTQ